MFHIPFTYRLTWSKYGISYYGSRYAKNCHPSDLWTKYFTSSKYVKEFRKLYGEPDIRKVTRTFPDDVKACLLYESRVLNRINARDNPRMLNRSNPNSYGPPSIVHPKGMLGKSHTIDYIDYMSEINSGTNNPMYGKSRPDLAEWNRQNAAANGLKVSKYRLNKKLKRLDLTAEELFFQIQNIIDTHPEYINKTGRYPGTMNFGKIANHFPKWPSGGAIKRFYDDHSKDVK